jgi:excisionase family DNA binding protein
VIESAVSESGFLTGADAAKLLAVSVRTVQRLVADGKLLPPVLVTGSRKSARYRASNVLAFAEELSKGVAR